MKRKDASGMDWQREMESITPKVISWRHELHSHPELSGREAWTQDFLERRLAEMGIPCRRFEGCYGLMATLENGEGKCVGIRADMDALPIREETGLPFSSATPGIMHACGHDVHMALALGCAQWMAENRSKWRGTVKWFFEPAEETEGGARWMVKQGCMESPKVDVMLGQHVNPHFPAGVFYGKSGCVSGSSDELVVTLYGKSCHGAYPEGGVDAIVMAAQVVSALQSLVSREVSPFEPVALTFGTIAGGTAGNIVCGEVKLRGILRTLQDETRQFLRRRLTECCEGVARAMGGRAKVDVHPSYGAVVNDEAAYALVEAAARRVMGEKGVVHREKPSLGVESFCYFLDDTPGVYYDIGSGVGDALHTSTFLVDETCLTCGTAMQCAAALALLGGEEDQ